MKMLRVLIVGLAFALARCQCGPEEPLPDGGDPTDASVPDSGTQQDSGTPDAGESDAGTPDAGPPDAGPPDAGPPDAGPPDAGPPDAGPPPACMTYDLLPPAFVSAGGEPTDIITADFNQDGHLDLAVTDWASALGSLKGVRVLFGRGDGTFRAAVYAYAPIDGCSGTTCIPDIPNGLATADMNRDGFPDIALANINGAGMGSVRVALAHDSGFWPPTPYRGPPYPLRVTVGDFNGDGWPDVAATESQDRGVAFLLSQGDGGLDGGRSTFAGNNPEGLAALDFNRDGLEDLAVADPWTNTLSILASGAGEPRLSLSLDAGDYPYAVGAADLDKDGWKDLVATSGTLNYVTVHRNVRDGGFAPAEVFGVPDAGGDLALADLDRDGWFDLATTHFRENTLAVTLGLDGGQFAPSVRYTATGPSAVTIGDFNEDGVLDMATINRSNRLIQVFRGRCR